MLWLACIYIQSLQKDWNSMAILLFFCYTFKTLWAAQGCRVRTLSSKTVPHSISGLTRGLLFACSIYVSYFRVSSGYFNFPLFLKLAKKDRLLLKGRSVCKMSFHFFKKFSFYSALILSILFL